MVLLFPRLHVKNRPVHLYDHTAAFHYKKTVRICRHLEISLSIQTDVTLFSPTGNKIF